MVEVTLRNGQQLAVFVAGKLHAETFIVLEAFMGLFKDVFDQRLIAKAVVIVNDIVQSRFDGGVLHALEVSARSRAQPAPVRRPLICKNHVFHMFPCADGCP